MKAGGIRILLTVDAVGGVWQYALDLSRELGAAGHHVVLALLGPAPDAAQHLEVASIPHVDLVETGLPLDWLCDAPEPVLAAGEQIGKLARDHGADIVQLNMPTLAASCAAGVPTVAVTHGCVSTWWEAAKPSEPLGADYLWHRDLMAAGLRAADRLIAPSVSYAESIAEHYHLPVVPHVVHNGRTPLVTRSGQALHDRVLTVGRLWDRVKRSALLDQVAGRLTVPFDAAGALIGPHGESVTLEHLNPLGQLDATSLGQRLSERPIFVSAASFEPFGLAVLEAASAGCALVLSDIPTFRELWDGAALFVPGDDAGSYVAAIERLIGDSALRLELGEAARDRSIQYSPRRMTEAMLAIFAELLASPAAGRIAA